MTKMKATFTEAALLFITGAKMFKGTVESRTVMTEFLTIEFPKIGWTYEEFRKYKRSSSEEAEVVSLCNREFPNSWKDP